MTIKSELYLPLISLILISLPLTTNAVDKVTKATAGKNTYEKVTPGERMDNLNNADSLLKTADDIFQSRDYAAALEAYQSTLTKATEEFNRSVETESLAQIARMNLLLGRKDNGKISLAAAEAKADDADPQGWSRFLGVRGRFEWQDGDLKTARATFETMYDYCKSNTLYGRSIDAAHMVAIVSETPEEQIEWGQIGIEAAEKTDNERWLGPLWNNMAGTYYDQKDFDNALECYIKAREYHWRFSGEIGKLYADYHVGMTHRLLGNYTKASQWLRPVLAWAERLENHSAIGQACEDLGEIEAANGNNSSALALLKRARDEYKLEGYDSSWADIWDNINSRIKQVESK